MNTFLIKGDLCFSEDPYHIRLCPDSYLLCRDGLCKGIFPQIPEQYKDLPLKDYSGKMIIPGMSDLHVHAPQFSYRGLGMDMELLDWLNTYTFPEESKYTDLDYADLAYQQFVDALRRSTTTRASVFATVHNPATELLMEKMEASGLISCVGKVNMDRNCPDYIREKSAAASVAATEEWICHVKDRFRNTKPILTPRFIPTCTDELIKGLRTLVEKYHVPVQSHLSENFGEIAWVKELCPGAKNYGDAYDRFGLFGGDHPCIMAHCVHSDAEEQALMKKNGVFIAHSPLSNTNIASGVAPISAYIKGGLEVGLASDVAGGDSENLLHSIVGAIRASKLRWRLLDQEVKPLSVDEAFYIATLGGGRFFGQVGSFLEGYEFDAVVLDDSTIVHPQELSLRARLERSLYLADDRHIMAKFVKGNQLF
ncbi:MAG: amidohydrolase family protein [Oscillospiraceae bacterium]|nr:amidohydrolase family protein [Oscillospiraceae bacterium]